VLALVVASACNPSAPPDSQNGAIAMSITPASGSGDRQVFTASFNHPGGSQQFATVRILFNHAVDGRAGCYVYYQRASSSLLLVNDAGQETTRMPIGSPSHLANSQCELDGAGSSVRDTGTQLTVRFPVQFKPSFKGKVTVYLFGEETNGQSTGFKASGSWDLP